MEIFYCNSKNYNLRLRSYGAEISYSDPNKLIIKLERIKNVTIWKETKV